MLGNGSQYGIQISYLVQDNPNGVAEIFSIAENFIKGHKLALILGDNLFHGTNLNKFLDQGKNNKDGALIYAYSVKDISKYGALQLDENMKPKKIIEKPKKIENAFAIPGLYFYDETVLEKAKRISPSHRGELEISDINQIYLDEKNLKVSIMGRGMTWFDTGEIDSLNDASNYVRMIQNRQGLKIGCPEEIALRNSWISFEQIKKSISNKSNNEYEKYLLNLINDI